MRRPRKAINQINVVPYIDVMLVLLVIFMITAPLITPGEITLPSVGSVLTTPVAPMQIQIKRDATLMLKEGTASPVRVSRDELIARIHAIVRRSKGHAQSVIQTGDLIVNLDTKTVEVNGARVHLTGKEYQMLELLSLRKGTTLTKEMFLNHLYGGMDEPELKIIDVFICKLRKKLANASAGKNYIETVWGRGYVLREPIEGEERIPA